MLGGKLTTVSAAKLSGAGLCVLVLLVGGAWGLGIVGTPAVAGVDNAFGPVNESTTVIESELIVNNPNPITIDLGGLSADYAVEMNGIRMATGHKDGVKVASRGNSSVPFRTEMNNSKLPAWWVSHVENDETTTLTVDASVHSTLLGRSFSPKVEREISTNIIGAFNTEEDRPIDANQPVVADPVLWLNRTAGEWGAVDENRTEIAMAFDLHNPKAIPLTITEIGYDIRMNGVSMGEGATDRTVVIGPGQTKTVSATTVLDNQKLDEWWVTHLRNDQTTTLEIEFYAVVDLSSAGGGTLRIPLDAMERTIETDMFGTKNSSTAGSGDGSGSTPTSSPTPEPTATPTDEGII